MKVFAAAICLCVVSTLALPLGEEEGFLLENELGEQFYAVPLIQGHSIQKRQTGASLDHMGNLGLSHSGTILNNDRHRLDGTAFGGRNINHHDTWTTGGQLDYAHKPTGSGLTAGAATKPGFGTDAFARGNYNIYSSPNGQTTAGVAGQYSRHYGGPQGTGKADRAIFANFEHRF